MDLIHKIINMVAPPTTIIIFLLFLPSFYMYKLMRSFLTPSFPENMANKVVLITGASSGIGKEIAYQYAKKGACLVLVARREDRLQQVAKRARELGSPDVLIIPADVSKVDDCKRFIDEAVGNFGQLNHLINNAGIVSFCMFEDATDLTHFAPVMDVNFWGSIYPTHFALPHLRRSRGNVVVNTSVAGRLPVARMSFYNASKAAVINFYDTLRLELGPEIKITIVAPGWVESELSEGKFLSKEGKIRVDQQVSDVQIGGIPVASAEGCAKAIVNSACRGDRYLTYPSWYQIFFLCRMLAPEVLEWCHHFRAVTRTGPHVDAPSKSNLDVTEPKELSLPPSIRSPELKAE